MKTMLQSARLFVSLAKYRNRFASADLIFHAHRHGWARECLILYRRSRSRILQCFPLYPSTRTFGLYPLCISRVPRMDPYLYSLYLVHTAHRGTSSSSSVLGIIDFGPILSDGVQQLGRAISQILDPLKSQEEIVPVGSRDRRLRDTQKVSSHCTPIQMI